MAATLVQSLGTNALDATGTTLTLTVPVGGVPIGDTIFIAAISATTGGAPTCADARGNVYTRDKSATSPSNISRLSFFSCPVTVALLAGDLITVTYSVTITKRAIAGAQFTGMNSTGILDVSTSASGTSTAPSATTGATTNANDLVIGIIGVDGPTADTFTEMAAFSGHTLPRSGTNGGGADETIDWAYKVVSSTGTQNYAPTLGTSRGWVDFVLTYKAPNPVTAATFGVATLTLSGRDMPGPEANAYRAAVMALSPVGYWRLGESAGTTAADSAGGHDAVHTASPTLGVVGAVNGNKAIAYNGSSQLSTAPSAAAFSLPTTGELSVVVWLRPDALDMPNVKGDGSLHFAGKGGALQEEWRFRMYNKNAPSVRPNRMSFYLFSPAGGNGVGAFIEEPIAVGTWYMLVGVAKVSDTSVKLYKNGTLRNTQNWVGQITPTAGPAPITFGTVDSTDWFQGGIDEVAIFPTALTAAQITNLYNLGVALAPGAATNQWDWSGAGAGGVGSDCEYRTDITSIFRGP